MIVYDFDGTIYDGDSSVDFYLFCLRRSLRVLKATRYQALGIVRFFFGKINRDQLKEACFSFLRFILVDDDLLREFWETHSHKLKDWYVERQSAEDLIISASPEFLLKPLCDDYGIRLIASRIDVKTGVVYGRNCRGEEKVRRFRELYPEEEVTEFYTDSYADLPMAILARDAFFIKGEKVYPLIDGRGN